MKKGKFKVFSQKQSSHEWLVELMEVGSERKKKKDKGLNNTDLESV